MDINIQLLLLLLILYLIIFELYKYANYSKRLIFAALLHVIPVSFGVIKIQSVETRLYLAFDKKGRLYGEVRKIL